MSITINGATNTISSTGTVTLPTVAGVTSLGNTALGDAEASDTHAIKGATTLLANSASAALTVTQTGAGNAFVVEDSASTDSTPFVIDASGNVVIGGVTAATSITGTAKIQLHGAGESASALSLQNYQASSSYFPSIEFAKSKNSTDGSHTVVASGDILGRFYFTGSDGAAFIRAAQIEVAVDGTPGTNDMPGRLVFSTTADGASSPTEAMRIDSKQNVGIGGAAATGLLLQISKTATGATFSDAVNVSSPAASDVTGGFRAFQSRATTAAAAFTLSNLYHYYANPTAFGAGSTVTNQFGYFAESTLTGATNNYGFYANIAAASSRWNFYAAGTAANYFGGNVTVGGGGTLGYGAGSGGTVTQASTRTTGVTLNKPSGDVTLVSAAGSATYQSLTVTNSAVEATDSISCSQKSGTDLYEIHTTNVAAGSFRITYRTTGGTTTEQPVFHFNVIKGAAS